MKLLENDDVEALLTPGGCIAALESAYAEWGKGFAAQFPEGGRMDLGCSSPGAETLRRFTWGAMAAIIPSQEIFALRQKVDIHYVIQEPDGRETQEKYCISPGQYCGLVFLADTRSGEPLAVVKDGLLQHLRVAATGALAARYLARTDSRILGLLGSGGMARAHAEMLCNVREFDSIHVFSPTERNRLRFVAEMEERLGVSVTPAGSAEEAVAGADVVAFCTDSSKPIFPDTAWVERGMHVTNVLAYDIGELRRRADVTVLHQRGGAIGSWAGRNGSPGKDDEEELRSRVSRANIERDNSELPTLAEVVIGKGVGRTDPDQVTYFHNSPGAGIQFAALGAELVRKAVEANVGKEIPVSYLLQDIRD